MLLDVGCKWYLNSEVSGATGAHIDDGFSKLAFDNKPLDLQNFFTAASLDNIVNTRLGF
jgi:hypothetical protein